MAAQRKAKKKGVLTIPPELQEYIKGNWFPSFTGKEFQGYETWGQLSPEKTYEHWKKTDPYGLYLIQLKDYLQFRLDPTRFGDSETKPITVEEASVFVKEANSKMQFGYPVEALPLYEESSMRIGANFQHEYENLLVQESPSSLSDLLSPSPGLQMLLFHSCYRLLRSCLL